MREEEFIKERVKIAAAGRYDPLLFAEYAWPWGVKGGPLEGKDIRQWQADILDTISQHLQDPETRFDPLFLSVASGHGIGKSAGMGMLSNWAMSCYKNPRINITANTEGQLRTKTSPEVGQWFRMSMFGEDLFEIDTMSIRYRQAPEQHRVDFVPWSETRPESFAGLHAEGRLVMFLMDEASAIPDIIWETAEGALTDENTVMIFVAFGNPTRNRGRFRECFRKYQKILHTSDNPSIRNDPQARWHCWQIDSRSVEGTNKKYLDEQVALYGENSDTAKMRVRGMFPNASAHQFIPTSYVDNAFGRHLREDEYKFAPTILSCDPAWDGDDNLVIAMRQGLYSQILEVLERNTNDVLVASKLAAYEDKYDADAVFIDGGYGTGLYSVGTTMGREWRLVWFGGEASKLGFKNKRAEMWWEMRNWLGEGGSVPPDQQLYDDLIAVETKPDTGGIVQLQPKQEMKKEGLPSPDRGDALALTFAYPVMKKLKPKPGIIGDHAAPKGFVQTNEEYDPHV